MANISAIKLPNGQTYTLKDNGALQLTGGQVTGPVTFDEVTSINGVTVGDNPKFTDNNYYHTSGSWSGSNNLTYTAVANGGAGTLAFTLATASTNIYGVTKLSDATDSNSTILAATANAVKKAYDLAASKTANTGTVTSIDAGIGLTGGPISTTGTLKANLRSETALTRASAAATEVANRVYPVAIDKDGYLAVNIPWTDTNTKVNVKARGTTVAYLLGTTVSPTTSNQAVESVAETGVYFDSTAATLVATTFKGNLDGTATGNLTSNSTLAASKLSGAIPSTVTATTQSASDNSTKIATTAYVTTAIANLPEPMQFIGTVGTNGTTTWTNLPTAATGNKGYTYKVITDHSAETGKPAANVGDTIISTGSEWVVIPSGDEPSGTVTSVKIEATSPIAIDSADAITSTGTRTISHANSGATAGSYGDSSNQTPGYGSTFKVPYITVNATGHITSISTHTVKIPASDNTDDRVTSVGNHYTPTKDSGATLSVDASSTTSATWGTTALVTGVNLERDAAGHVTGITVDSIKMPNNPNTTPVTSVNSYTGAVVLTATDVGALPNTTAVSVVKLKRW